MPVYEIQDPQGRTLEIDGNHEPTAEELTNIFTQAFPAQAQPAPERPALVRAPLPTMGPQGQQMLQTGMEQLSKPLINIPEKAPDFGTRLPEEVPEGILKKTGQAIGGEALKLLSGVTSPIGLASIPAMMVAPEVVGPLMAMSMAPVVGEGVKQTIAAKDIPEAARGITKTVFGGAGVAGGLLAPLHARLLPKSAEETAKATGEKVPVAPKESEVSDATRIREDEGQVPESRVQLESRQAEGGPDLERSPQVQPSGTTPPKEAEVAKPPPLSTAERAEVQAELSQAMAEEPASPAAPKLGEVGKLALEEQRKAGWNPKWPFVPADLGNADFRELIRKDPALSAAEKQQIFSAGEKLGVVPKETAPVPKVEETKPALETLWHAERKQGSVKEGKALGMFLTNNEDAAHMLARGETETGKVQQFQVEIKKPLVIPPNMEPSASGKPWFDMHTGVAFNKFLKDAGVKFTIDPVEYEEDVWRMIDEGGTKLVNAIRRAGYDAVKYPEHLTGRDQTTTLLIDHEIKEGKALSKRKTAVENIPSGRSPVKGSKETGVGEPPVQPIRTGPVGTASPGPGAAASGEPGTYSAIEQLSDRLRTVPSEAKADPLNWRERMADTMTAGKNAFAKVVGRVRAISETMKEGIRGIRDINDVERAIGVADYEWQASSGESANLGKVMKRTYKDANMRRAAALYIDAGGDIKQFQDALARGLPQGTRPEVRRAIETVANMSDEGKQLVDFLREYYGIREGEAVASDIFKEGLDDYYTHIWKKEANMPEKLRAAITTGKVNTYWQFARQRKISTFLEGIMEGKTPVLDPAEVVPYYNFTLDRAIASRAFVKQLSTIDASDGRPAVAATGTRQEIAGNKDMVLIRPQAKNSTYADYRSVDHPAMHRWKWAETTPDGKTVLYQGELQVHPEFYERLARFMERSRLTPGRTARATLRVGSEMKAAKFGLASTFHQIHVGAHAAFHWANPFKVSNRPWVAEDGLINFRHPFVQEAIEKGHLKIAPEPWELNVMSEGILNHGSLIHKVPFIGPWSRVYSEWLFTNYIPKLKLATYEAALPRNRRWFAGKLTDEQIQARVGDAVNNAYGELNRLFLGKYGRDPRFQRALQMAFLAPDFGEARLRFVSKALTKAGAEERLALATMFTTLYTTARIGNYLSHGNPEWDWKKAFSVKVGDHWFSIRSVIGDVDHALADFVQFATVRLSPLSRTLLEGLSKRDARGQKRLPSEQVGDFMRQFIPISLQGVAEPERAMWESFSSAMGLSARRENSEQEVRLMVRDWMKKSKDPAVQNKLARIEKETFAPSEYGPLRSKLRLHDMQGAQEEYRKLRRVKTPQMIDTAMRPTRPLAGSYKMELEFRRSLKPSERSIYNRAKRDREQQYERFLQLPR